MERKVVAVMEVEVRVVAKGGGEGDGGGGGEGGGGEGGGLGGDDRGECPDAVGMARIPPRRSMRPPHHQTCSLC